MRYLPHLLLLTIIISLLSACAGLESKAPRFIEVTDFPVGKLSIACHLADLSKPDSLKVLWTKSGTFMSDGVPHSYLVQSDLTAKSANLEIRRDGKKIVDTILKADGASDTQIMTDLEEQTEIKEAIKTAYSEWKKQGSKYSCPNN